MLIDPLDSGIDGVAELARQTTVPVAISAAVRSPADIVALWRRGAAPHLVIDLAVVGGLWPARNAPSWPQQRNCPLHYAAGPGWAWPWPACCNWPPLCRTWRLRTSTRRIKFKKMYCETGRRSLTERSPFPRDLAWAWRSTAQRIEKYLVT